MGRAILAQNAIVPDSSVPSEGPMPVDAELLEILACPNCKTPVKLVKNGTALKCGNCHRVYPIKDDIPVMLIDEATIEPETVA
jgi:uncharacterized protein YbaR (Trm112 family)